jgi:hypothetical protein
MIEFYIDTRVYLILVFAHGPSSRWTLTGEGIDRDSDI